MIRCWVMAIWSFSHSDRTSETGHARWFYILSNAAMQCIGQTIRYQRRHSFGTQADRRTDGQIDGYRNTHRQTCLVWHNYRQTDRQTDVQLYYKRRIIHWRWAAICTSSNTSTPAGLAVIIYSLEQKCNQQQLNTSSSSHISVTLNNTSHYRPGRCRTVLDCAVGQWLIGLEVRYSPSVW